MSPHHPHHCHAALPGVQDGGGKTGWPCPPHLSPELQTGECRGQPIAHPMALQPETFWGERRDGGSSPFPTVDSHRNIKGHMIEIWVKGRNSLHGWTLTLGSKEAEPQIGQPSHRVLHGADKPPWMLGRTTGTDRRAQDV